MKHLFVIIFLLFTNMVVAQKIATRLSSAEGMTNSSINSLYQDGENVLWIGTWDGLHSYNGRDLNTFRYDSKDPYSIGHNIIRQVIGQDSIHIWVATDDGLNRFDKRDNRFTRFFNNHGGFILSLMQDDTFICYLHNDGLYQFVESEKQFVKLGSDVKDNVKKLVVDKHNNLYVLYHNGTLKKYKLQKQGDNIKINWIENIATDSYLASFDILKNDKLVLIYSTHIEIVDAKNNNHTTIESYENKQIKEITLDENNIYILSENNELEKYNIQGGYWSKIESELKNINISSLLAGSQSMLWIATDGQGVIGLDESVSQFDKVTLRSTVRCFVEDSDSCIWVGTKGEGLKLFNKQTRKIVKEITEHDGLSSNATYVFTKNRLGDIFVGGESGKIDVISPNHKVSQVIIDSQFPIPHNIYSMQYLGDSLLYVGTSANGMYKIVLKKDKGQYCATDVTQYMHQDENPSSIYNNTVYTIIKDNENPTNLWLGTRGAGDVDVYNVQTGNFSNISTLSPEISLSSSDIICLLQSHNQIWIGTSYGLNKFVNQKPYSVTDFLQKFVNNTIHGLLQDMHNHIWVSTNYGLVQLNTLNNTVRTHTVKNGLHGNEFADGAAYMDSDSIFYFGGVDGFTYFDPNNVKTRSYSPKIKLSALQINNQEYSIYDKINQQTLNLSYTEQYLTLTFLADDFINNSDCEYSYRLEGYTDDWIYNGKHAAVILTKVPPGQYTLQVKCTNADGVWGDYIYSLPINIAYPWWRTNLAYFGYLLVFVFIVYLVVLVVQRRRRRSKQILIEQLEREHQQQLLESKLNFFSNVAHEFFTPLTLIYTPSQILLDRETTDSTSKKYLRMITQNAEKMQKLIKELMEFRKVESGYITLKPEKVDIKTIIDSLLDDYNEIASVNGISLLVNLNNVSTIVIDKSSVEKVLSNLISNAFKYTPAGHQILIDLNEDIQNKEISFLIRNEGVGLTEEQAKDIFKPFKIFNSPKIQNSFSNGIGLNLTKNLVDLLDGSISVDTIEHQYVTFRLVLPTICTAGVIDKDNPDTIQSEINTKKNVNPTIQAVSKTILIVEDEKDIRELLVAILSPYYFIKEAADGIQGLAEVYKEMPDIIITDMMMPNMNGINFIDQLKEDERTAHIPIVGISAKNSIEDHIDAYKHGADLYVEKPFNPAHILVAVDNLIEKQSALDEYFSSSRSKVKIREGVEVHETDQMFVQNVIAFIEKNIDNEALSSILIADHLKVSKTTFYEKLKKLTGSTPSEFIKKLRLEHAGALLKTTKLTVSEVVYTSGFTSRSYFYREFAKYYNMSPNEYRGIH